MPVNLPNDSIDYIENGEPLSGTDTSEVSDAPLNRGPGQIRENQKQLETFVNDLESQSNQKAIAMAIIFGS